MNGDNSNASTIARWKVLDCHVGLQNDHVHFCISVPVFALDVGTCLPRSWVSQVCLENGTRNFKREYRAMNHGNVER